MKTSPAPLSRREQEESPNFPGNPWLVLLAVFLISGLGYLLTLAPTVTSEDSGELITAAVTLGVPHPPGYPLWTLLAHAFSLLPFDNPAKAVNLMSAFFGSLTAGALCLCGLRLGLGRCMAAAVGLIYAFSERFWSQAVIAEVYTLNSFLFFTCIYFLLGYRDSRSNRDLRMAGVIFGIGLANHYMLMLLVSPALVGYLILITGNQEGKKWRIPPISHPFWIQLLIAMLASCAGLLFYLYLPWAASRNPPINWGDPSNLERFMAVLSRKAYRSLDFGAAPTIGTKLLFFLDFIRMLCTQYTPYLVVPGLVLAVSCGGVRRAERLLLAAIIFLNGPLLIYILHFTFEEENRSRVEEYYLPAWGCVALLIGLGLEEHVRGLARSWRYGLPLAAALLVFLANHKECDYSKNRLSYDYNHAILESLEKNAVYFPAGDYNAFPLLYLQAVEKVRPDVLLADITGTLSQEALAYARTLNPKADTLTMADAQALMAENGSRPIYFTDKSDCRIRGKYRLHPWGWVYRLETPATPLPEKKPVLGMGKMSNAENPTPVDDLGNSILSSVHLMEAENAWVAGDRPSAMEHYRQAVVWSAISKEGLNNIGATMGERGLQEEAVPILRHAADLYPGYPTARKNLIQTLKALGRQDEVKAVEAELRLISDMENRSVP